MNDWTKLKPWLPVTLMDSDRTTLHKIVKALDVVDAPRYKRDANTYCNIFVWDVTRNARCEVPHWVVPHTDLAGEVGGKNVELDANAQIDWLSRNWVEQDRNAAFASAEAGYLVVVTWRSPPGGIGHVAVLLPEGTIAQAGAHNFVGAPIGSGFGRLPVKFYVSPQRVFFGNPK